MERDQIHFEVFVRRKSGANWTLEQATEDRAGALKAAEELLKTGKAVGVKVTSIMVPPPCTTTGRRTPC